MSHLFSVSTAQSLGNESVDNGEIPEIQVTAKATLPTQHGRFGMISFRSSDQGEPHIALTIGLDQQDKKPLVRVHSECITGDVFGSLKCECGEQLQMALQEISRHGSGVLIYLRQEGRGIGIENKIKAYALQEEGYDTIDSNLKLGLPIDGRTYGDAAAILDYLNISSIELLTNNPLKISALEGYGIEIGKRRKIVIETGEESKSYMDTKQNKMGHMLD